MLSHATFEPSIGLQNHLTFCVTTCTSADNSATRACPNTRTLDLCPTHTCLQMIYEDVHRRENPRGHSETHAHSEETILNRLRWRLRDLLLIKASSRPSLLSPSLPTPPPPSPHTPPPSLSLHCDTGKPTEVLRPTKLSKRSALHDATASAADL